jgi:dolichol-phosphate mannosyltransferase
VDQDPRLFMTGEPTFAVVVPFFNERSNVEAVCLELKAVVEKELRDCEIVLVDDGSSDGTAATLDELARHWPNCRVYHLEENQGQSAALLFGFRKTSASFIVTMDGDGQNDPHDIPKLLARLDEADMVVGARVLRQDSWARRVVSRIANRIRSRCLGDGVSDAGCALKVFRREVANAFIPIRTLYSFMPALAVAGGFRVVEVPVAHRPREHGNSRYTLRSFLFLPIVDFIGLAWFRARRCKARPYREVSGGNGKLIEVFEKSATRKSLAIASVLALFGILPVLLRFSPPASLSPDSDRVSLVRAERVALRQVRDGKLTVLELRRQKGRLIWQVDVRRPRSGNITEVDVDAVTGLMLATRTESPEEEKSELGAEDTPVRLGRHLP